MKARIRPDRSRPTTASPAAGRRVLPLALAAGLLLAGCAGVDPGDGGSSPGVTPTTGPTSEHPTTDDQATSGGGSGEEATADDTAGGTGDEAGEGTASETSAANSGGDAGPPELDVQVVMDGLSIPWDVQLLPDGTALVTERDGRVLRHTSDGETAEVDLDLSEVVARGEGGLMGLAVSPDFEQDRTVFLCHTSDAGGTPDVRVTRWLLDEEAASGTQDGVVVDGIPYTSGRHSGCRLIFSPEGDLLVGTGDAADSPNPQDLAGLGGKVLAVTPDGDPTDEGGHVPDADPRILSYGHRNVQGLAVQPGTSTVWEVEHGPDVDDEVNVLQPGANYGWDPGPGYDEGVPMTDLDAFPDAVEAVWSSGRPTHATSGAVFLEGERWGAWDGALAVAELKGSGVTVLTVDGEEVTDAVRVPELDGTYGRLRSLTLDADGALWVTTSNGDGDVVLRVTPRG